MQESFDPAWDEYLSTGIDPTGGELGPDFDPDTGEPLEEVKLKKNNTYTI